MKKTRESRFGNEMYYAESSKTPVPELHFEVVYDVVRHERLILGVARPRLAEVQLKDRDRKEYLQPDKLVPVTGLPADLAVKVTQGEITPLDKARAIYDYVFTTMRYDKTGTGWGHGDVLYACDAKKGNCTDFHSLFIAMARSQGIPARFEIGFPLPPDKHSAKIAGYHCWSDFFEPQHGWVPVDISEAWKHQEKRNRSTISSIPTLKSRAKNIPMCRWRFLSPTSIQAPQRRSSKACRGEMRVWGRVGDLSPHDRFSPYRQFVSAGKPHALVPASACCPSGRATKSN
jgi:transglutaminase-like putative cysteine protease